MMGTGEKTFTILNKNYYGWFDKIQRGIYVISDIGKNELHEFPDFVNHYNEVVREAVSAYLENDDESDEM